MSKKRRKAKKRITRKAWKTSRAKIYSGRVKTLFNPVYYFLHYVEPPTIFTSGSAEVPGE